MVRSGVLLSRWGGDVDNPLNWPRRKKYLILALVSYIDLLTPLTSMMFAPGLPSMQSDFHNSNTTLATLAMTIYVLGFCVGPLIFAPLSEVYGRAAVYKGCVAMFLLFTLACGSAQSIGALICFRFIAGCFGAAPVAIGGAMVYDLFRVDERGGALAVYAAGPLLGNLLGPPLGGLIIEYRNWRWVFWIVSVLAFIALACSLSLLEETHAPVILSRKVAKVQVIGAEADERTPLDPAFAGLQAYRNSEIDDGLASNAEAASSMSRAFRRPLELLFFSPVCAACSLVIILAAGTTNLIFASLARIFQNHYGFSASSSGLIYLAVTVGFVIAAFTFGGTSDHISRLLARTFESKIEPEFRLPAMMVGLPLVALGLVWYGWSAQKHAFWIVPTLGLNVVGLGITTVQLSLQIYVVESFAEFAASALAATTVARSFGGALLPLAGPAMYEKFGLGMGNSLLALVNLLMCLVPGVLFVYGKGWREGTSVISV